MKRPKLPNLELGVRVEWVHGYKYLYAIDTKGRVWTCRVRGHTEGFAEWRQRAATPDKDGYLMVFFSNGGKKVTRKVHSLVLETFVGPCPPGMECRHFPDPDKTNNNLENVSWGTSVQNKADNKIHGVGNSGERHGLSKATDQLVRLIRERYVPYCPVNGGVALAEEFDLTTGAISMIVNKKRWNHI